MARLKVITKNAPDSPYTVKYHDDQAIPVLTQYAFNDEKTIGYIGGWAVDPRYAAYEMELLDKLYHKEEGVRLRHWGIFFDDADLMPLTAYLHCDMTTAAYYLGYEFSAFYADRYQIIFGVHAERGVPHLHFVMNTVSYVDGHKYSGSKTDYYAYLKYAKSVATKYRFILYDVKDQSAMKNIHAAGY